MESLASVAQTEKNLVERPRLGGAFASYVRHRGEPDGKTMEPSNVLIPASRQSCQNGGGINFLKINLNSLTHNFVVSKFFSGKNSNFISYMFIESRTRTDF